MGKEYCVYVHTNKTNGKKYVGITCQMPEKRWQNGKGYKFNFHFWAAIQKYGWDNFEHEIIISQIPREEACKKEFELIESLDTKNPLFGYNKANGGIGVNSISDQTKELMRIKRTEYLKTHPEAKTRLTQQYHEYYQNLSPEEKAEYREKRKRLLAEHPERKVTKPIRQYDFDGNYIRDWESAALAETEGKYDRKKICHCLRGHTKCACGFLWKYKDESEPTKIEALQENERKPAMPKKYKRHACGVRQYDRDGNYIKTFKTILDASAETGTNKANITACCNGKAKTAGSYQWRYNDENAPDNLKENHKYEKKAVAKYSLDGTLIKEYASVPDALKDNPDIKHGICIHRVCNGERISFHGYTWRYNNAL